MFTDQTNNMKKLFPEPPVLQDETLCLRPLVPSDAEDLRKLTLQEEVYRWLPTFLFEQNHGDMDEVIRRLYDEGLDDSLILGVFREGRFCGLAEVYGYKAPMRKASVGYRLLREEWGHGIATEALSLLMDELVARRGVIVITASTMLENEGSANVLRKNDFSLVGHGVREDWGFPEDIPVDKWVRLQSLSQQEAATQLQAYIARYDKILMQALRKPAQHPGAPGPDG